LTAHLFALGPESQRKRCSTTGCGGRAVAQCDFKLSAYGRTTACKRFVCARCRSRKSDGTDLCPPHSRFEKAKAAP
jgi:hypothetical protein